MASETKKQTYIYDSISESVTGSEFTHAYSHLMDEYLAGLFSDAAQALEVVTTDVALLAVGGYLSLIHISEPTRQAEISYAVFCLKKKK